MIQKLLIPAALTVSLASFSFAQNTNSSAARGGVGVHGKTAAASMTTGGGADTQAAAARQEPATPAETPAPAARARRAAGRARAQTAAEAAATRALRASFDALVDGIRKADAEGVMAVYWNSPQLVLFNNNGTVTKSWSQVRENRESLYAKVRDVKLDVRDVNVRLLGPGSGVVSCLWEQTQTHDGQPERATGRLTLVFQKVGTEWKAVHAHTSPDRPDPARLLPSERTTDAPAETKPTAKP